MSSLVELFVNELTKEGATMTIDDVPKGLRSSVEEALKKKHGSTVKAKAVI